MVGYPSRSTLVWPEIPTPTLAQAIQLWKVVDRRTLLVKIPATEAGLPALTGVLAAGAGVNVTLISPIERYRAVMEAYLQGMEQASANGHPLASISVSFFVSRVDTEIDQRLNALGTDEALALAARQHWPTAAPPTPPSRMCSSASDGSPRPPRALGTTPALGLHRHQEPGPPRHPLRE